MVAEDRIFFNGIDGATGRYLVPPRSLAELSDLAAGRRPSSSIVNWLRQAWESVSRPYLGLPMGVDPRDPGQAGWGIVLGVGEPAEVRDALTPLVEHRRRQIGDRLTKVLDYRPGEGWSQWLARHQVSLGSPDPARVPYYLLLVGGPEAIPFEFQSLLDVEYAVGRLAFDSASGYGRYAASLVEHEREPVGRRPDVTLFGTRHPGDPATELSSDLLLGPLADERTGIGAASRCPVTLLAGDGATRSNLTDVLRDPARRGGLLFTATHGLGWPRGHPGQETGQGALICQDWSLGASPTAAQCFGAGDVPADARLRGSVVFLFACYSAGTPQYDDYLVAGSRPAAIANRPFVAALPGRLLSHPGGAAIGVIGHVERAWGYSFAPPGVDAHLLTYRNALCRLLAGEPIGYAMKEFNELFASLSTELTGMQRRQDQGARVERSEMTRLWIRRNDAQNYILLGDPAARLSSDAGASATAAPDPRPAPGRSGS